MGLVGPHYTETNNSQFMANIDMELDMNVYEDQAIKRLKRKKKTRGKPYKQPN